jgi:hypothetical protein
MRDVFQTASSCQCMSVVHDMRPQPIASCANLKTTPQNAALAGPMLTASPCHLLCAALAHPLRVTCAPQHAHSADQQCTPVVSAATKKHECCQLQVEPTSSTKQLVRISLCSREQQCVPEASSSSSKSVSSIFCGQCNTAQTLQCGQCNTAQTLQCGQCNTAQTLQCGQCNTAQTLQSSC